MSKKIKRGRIDQINRMLDERKAKICGVDIELTTEQLAKLKSQITDGKSAKKEKSTNPYDRVENDKDYYIIDADMFGSPSVFSTYETNDEIDSGRFKNGNYYNDKEFAEQVAMGMELQQKLRKFTYENGWSEDRWNDEYAKWYIYFDTTDKELSTEYTFFFKEKNIYFDTGEIAQKAIDEIIKPFMKEHPNFKW